MKKNHVNNTFKILECKFDLENENKKWVRLWCEDVTGKKSAWFLNNELAESFMSTVEKFLPDEMTINDMGFVINLSGTVKRDDEGKYTHTAANFAIQYGKFAQNFNRERLIFETGKSIQKILHSEISDKDKAVLISKISTGTILRLTSDYMPEHEHDIEFLQKFIGEEKLETKEVQHETNVEATEETEHFQHLTENTENKVEEVQQQTENNEVGEPTPTNISKEEPKNVSQENTQLTTEEKETIAQKILAEDRSERLNNEKSEITTTPEKKAEVEVVAEPPKTQKTQKPVTTVLDDDDDDFVLVKRW